MVIYSSLRYWFRTTLFLALALSLSGCETWEKDLENKKVEVLVETFLLPDASRTTIEGSFHLCDTENKRALHWIQNLYNASTNQEILQVFQVFQDSFDINKAAPSWEDFEATHNIVKELVTPQSNPSVVNRQAAFHLSAFLHRFYLRNSSTFRSPLKYLEPIYKRMMEGDIPECVANGKSTWHPAVYPMPWAIGIFIGFLMFRALLRSLFKKTSPKADKKPIPVKKTTPPPKEIPMPPPAKPAFSKLYVGLPSGNILTRLSNTFEPQTTYFVIEIDPTDQTRGKLSLVEDKATLLHAFSMIDALKDACELHSTGAPVSPDKITKNVPGEVGLVNGRWEIAKKIILEWSVSIPVPPRVKEPKLKVTTPEKPLVQPSEKIAPKFEKIEKPPTQQPNEKIEPPMLKNEITEKPTENQIALSEAKDGPPPVLPDIKAKPPQKPKLVYARMPAGSTFYQLSDYFQPNETFFVLSIFPDDPKTAFINLTEDPETREYFLTRELTHQNVCEFHSDRKPTPDNARVVEVGIAKWNIDHWTLKTSIKLDREE